MKKGGEEMEMIKAEIGQTVHYMARWVGKNGSKGPWSETVSATVPA